MIISRLLHRLIGLLSVIALTAILFYASRFWIWKAPWADNGLFGQKLFTPWGNVVHWWLQGTPFAEMSLIVWGGGAIIFLSILHSLASRIATVTVPTSRGQAMSGTSSHLSLKRSSQGGW